MKLLLTKNIATKFIPTLLLILPIPILCYPQVTVGMGSPPAQTALLQIKDKEPDENNETSTSGGLLLPRVKLIQRFSLRPFIDESDPRYDSCKKESVGLLVYNLASIDDMTPGLYFWDGEKWIGIAEQNDNPTPPSPSIDDPKALDLPNSYMIEPGQIESIPLMKGYAVWHQELGKDREELKGKISIELLWQTYEGLIKNLSLIEKPNLEDSFFKIETNDTKTEGNAVVGIKLDGELLWSWHIWVTYYSADDDDGQRMNGKYIFMDRNLGAITCSKNDIYSFGMLYQWGRKDPFPGSSDLTESDKERMIFDDKGDYVNIQKTQVATSNNLENAIKNPNIFYCSGNSNELSDPQDWYSNEDIENDYLWNKKDQTKGIYDPCPEGWRVPDKDAWNTAQWIESYRVKSDGLNLDEAEPKGGFYPFPGYRERNTGNLVLRNSNLSYNYATIWTSTPRTKDDGQKIRKSAHALLYRPDILHNPANSDVYRAKARGGSVRCIKDASAQ